MNVLFLILALSPEPYQIISSDTGIFNVLAPWKVAYYDQKIYLMDTFETQVKVYTSVGDLITIIGQKGSGPGDLEAPRQILFSPDGMLVVADRSFLNWYDKEGRFVKKVDLEYCHLSTGTKGFIDAYFSFYEKDDKQFIYYSSDFKKKRTLLTLDYDRNLNSIGQPFSYSPAQDTPLIRVNRAGTHAILKPQGSAQIMFYSLTDEKITRSIDLPFEKKPFNTDHEIQKYNRLKKILPPDLEYQSNFPEFYPEIPWINEDFEGNFLVGRPPEKGQRRHVVFDVQGNSVPKSKSTPVHPYKYIGHEGDQLFFWTYDEEEEVVLWSVPLASLDTFVKNEADKIKNQ